MLALGPLPDGPGHVARVAEREADEVEADPPGEVAGGLGAARVQRRRGSSFGVGKGALLARGRRREGGGESH